MKIFALCVVKNEADIIGECLQAASAWADRIFVYDGESTDGTWEKVLAMQNDRIVPWKRDGKVFQEALRAEIFNAFRHEASDGDWWCHLDADEFYVRNPRELLAAVPPPHHVVWGIAVEYYLTQQDVDTIDFAVPTNDILNALRYYRAENSEPRFFRHRNGLVWNESEGWPRHMGIATPERLLYKHYKFRSPHQMQLRIDTRRSSQLRGFVVRPQYTSRTWQEEIAKIDDLDIDQRDGQFRLREDRIPLHLDSPSRTLLKRFMHGTGLWP